MVREREAIRVCGRGFCISWRRSDQFTVGLVRVVAGLYRWLRSVLSWAWAWREWQPWVFGVTVVGICGEGGSSNRFCLGDLLFVGKREVDDGGRFGGSVVAI
ncbi:hypothetical protein NC652_032135 [Populus alba x Populus x berolinensis]|nr:hypothetical protein NC652_032135 [Populus alba x Populus x berolinensis]